MSQAADGAPSGSQTSKIQVGRKVRLTRLRGSCDECRRKKSKFASCDSAKMPDNICTNCQDFQIKCTRNFSRLPKKPEPQQDYILKLEARIEKLENYIKRMHPGEDVDCLINMALVQTPHSTRTSISSFQFAGLKHTESIAQPMSSDVVSSTSQAEANLDLSEGEDLAHVSLSEHLTHLSVHVVEDRFFGQASPFMLAKQVSTLRYEIAGPPNTTQDPNVHNRLLFWDLKPWELAFCMSVETSYVYPEDDLLMSLVSLYFEKTNCLMPILHQPTFMKSLSLGQHHWDSSFGMTVLMVCAMGSRYSRDPRVLVPDDTSGLSAGWQYFSQIPVHRKAMLCYSNTYDLQYYALATLFLTGTSMAHGTFNMLGIGLRCAWEKGAHRRRGSDQKPSVESELQKRAFWAIVSLERIGSAISGRPCGFPHEAFDVEYPIECDDEYWETEDPQKAFQQPVGKPCTITAFVHFIKLCEILGFALGTLYINKKSKLLSGFIGVEWERKIVAELDSSMNKWKDSLPDYLRWDPDRQDIVFFNQSANLHATSSFVQIQIHRPFLIKKSSLSFASLAMCTNAARSCTHILEAAMMRGLCVLPNTMVAAFTAGTIIALGLWGGHRSGYIGDPSKEIEMLHQCINVLHDCEKRWNWAGRLADVLNEVAALHQYHSMASQLQGPSRDQQFTPQRTSSSTQIPNQNPDFMQGRNLNSAFGEDVEETTLLMNDQDLYKTLLTEIGYLPSYPTGSLVDTGEGSNRPLQNNASTSYATPQPSESWSANEPYALWSDIPNVFSSSEEWEAYLVAMGKSHNF